ncbi:uncharacterized protein LOC101862894 [Aplysia californica]|uniref:Uncharacterized protein LOC101862894 n=1 Tax=Aplysia californica TaxID=6500 RepID=A0ABM1A8S5_APLCA|nr:uncharacterized protein LOC101862894 [Aplysia californica]
MSFLMGSKGKEKEKDQDPFAKKSQFYVEFLGWMECRGVRGARYTDPVIRELRRRQQKKDKPPKLTIQVRENFTYMRSYVQFVEIQFYLVLGTHGVFDSSVLCHLGEQCGWSWFDLFDEATTAATFARQISTLVDSNKDHIRDVEIDLANRGEIEDPRLSSSDGLSEQHTTDSAVGSASSAYSDEEPPTSGSDDIDPDLQSLHEVMAFDNVADELKFRLQMADKPLLLPPKDYDTISRAHGNLEHINRRRCLNLQVVGDWASEKKERNGSSESGVDLTSPTSDGPDGSSVTSGGDPASPSMQRHHHNNHQNNIQHLQQQQQPQAHQFHPQQTPIPFSDFVDHGNNHPVHVMGGGHQRGDSIGRGSSHHSSHHSGSRSASPEMPVDQGVYPPRAKHSPPMSPSVGHAYPVQRPHHLSRQSSSNSFNSHHSSEGAPPTARNNGTIYYKGGSSNDIYALPAKGKYLPNGNVSPRDIPPADYLDDEEEEVLMRGGPGPRYHQPNLTRSMPADLIRSEMALGSRSPRNSGDMRYLRRTDSPTFVGGPQQFGNPGNYSPTIKRVGSGKR